VKTSGRRRKTGKKGQKLKNKIVYFSLAFAIIIVCFLFYSCLNPSSTIELTPKAVIIDHLSLSYPNPNFSKKVQAIMKEISLPVDYYPSEEVDVNLYRNLPMHNYKIILFRVHSTGECSVEDQPPFVVFFTSEEYNTISHVGDQLAMRVVYVNFPEPHQSTTGYFGITPSFIKESVNGRFNESIIIAMGCDSLKYTSMAEAFIERGAKAYIGWTGDVSSSHTDKATSHLLQKLIIENRTLENAIQETMMEVGPDPFHNSTLAFYPDEAGNLNITKILNSEQTQEISSMKSTNSPYLETLLFNIMILAMLTADANLKIYRFLPLR